MKTHLSAVTIFLGSFLVFAVQPMVGRTILPVFGGTAAVWVVCLCAFQLLLLAGYFHAHLLYSSSSSSSLSLRVSGALTQPLVVRVHPALLIIAAVLTAGTAILRDRLLPMVSTGIPAADVLVCVVLLTGFSYVLLSANASLVQSVTGGEGVYRLYSVSNLGSLLGLLAYPFVLEPMVGITHQWLGFSGGIVVYAVLLWKLIRCSSNDLALSSVEMSQSSAEVQSTPVSSSTASLWLYLLLPAVSCFLLNALTTHVTLDIMPLPLVWTGSLALFLGSYILGFSGKAEKILRPSAVLTLVLLAAVCWTNGRNFAKIGLQLSLALYGGLLLVGCTFLHSWLYLIRPDASRLTKYYLFQSIGGALGGSIASLVFPLACSTVLEYPTALMLTALLVLWAFVSTFRTRFCLLVSLVLAALSLGLYVTGAQKETRPCVYRGRGFFGTIEVLEAKARMGDREGRIHEFVHGSTVHGIQVQIAGKERMPTCYYTMNSSGYAITGHPKYRKGEPMRVNVTGLGVGVLFSYGRKGDFYRAYEISEDALRVATDTNLFTFVSDCPASKEIVLGDARKGLEAELAAGVEPYDVIVVDAFTGDNLPYHLSTVEAFDLYFKLLKQDGILCVNISNWHLELEPFMKAVGDHYGCPLLGLQTMDHYPTLQFGAKVAFFCRQPQGLGDPPVGMGPLQARMIDFARVPAMTRLPTDEKGSFVSLIKWR